MGSVRFAFAAFVTWLAAWAASDFVLAQEWEESAPALLCRTVCQDRNEAWRTIPWKTNLIKAQHLAVAESKPIFIWAMDGHPLGCT